MGVDGREKRVDRRGTDGAKKGEWEGKNRGGAGIGAWKKGRGN
jgi:hypothetical protein